MTYPSDAEITALASAFRARTLPKSSWTHAAHFAAALHFLHEDEAAAFRDMPGMIRAYNASVGGRNSDTEGYHETITIASLRAAADALRAAPGLPLHTVLDTLLAGPCGKPDWLFAYWTKDRLMSPAARRTWTEPDLQPLPF